MSFGVIRIILILIALSIIYFIYNLSLSLRKSKRIAEFALEDDSEITSIFESIYVSFWKLIHKISNGLGKYKIINKLAVPFEKYVSTTERKYKNSVDYIAIKILFVIAFLLFDIIGMVLGLVPINLMVIIISIFFGYFLPDLFLEYLYIKKTNKINKDVMDLVKYIYSEVSRTNDLYLSINFALLNMKGPIVDELKKVLIDIDSGLSVSKSFERFYKRSGIKDVSYIANNLKLGEKLHISSKDTVKNIYDNMLIENKRKNKFFKEIDVYNYLFIVSLLIPALVYLFGSSIDITYFAKLYEDRGTFILIAIIVVYALFIFIVKNILEDNYE